MAQLMTCLLSKPEHLSLRTQDPYKKPGTTALGGKERQVDA